MKKLINHCLLWLWASSRYPRFHEFEIRIDNPPIYIKLSSGMWHYEFLQIRVSFCIPSIFLYEPSDAWQEFAKTGNKHIGDLSDMLDDDIPF